MAAADPAAVGAPPAPAAVPSPAERKPDLRVALEQFRLVAEATTTLRASMLDDKRFRASDQWPVHIKAERQRTERPFLTVNRLPQFIKQVTNQARQNRPSIQVNAVDDDADPDTADVLGGIIRHIETNSHAEVAYDTAVDDQVTVGIGYTRLVVEYEPGTFQQTPRIRRVPDSLNVFVDPTCVEADFADAAYGFERIFVDFATFKAEHPKAEITTQDSFVNILGDRAPQWMEDGCVAVVDWYYVEYEEIDLVLLDSGVAFPRAYAEAQIAAYAAYVAEQLAVGNRNVRPVPQIIDQRIERKKVVKFAKITGAEILEHGTWVGSRIPWFPCVGDEIRIDGKVDYRGIVRDAKDQQRVYNYQVTALVETIALAPKAPWIIADGQVEPFKRLWNQSNTKNWSYLPYKPMTSNGLLVPPPQRQAFEPAIQAISMAVAQADNDMKAVTGFYDDSLGERGPSQSGKAILARQRQSDLGSSNYMGNLGRMLWALGTELIVIIPKVMDAPRILRIIGKDDQQQTVMVHSGRPEDVPQQLPKGVGKVFDLGTGRYDITVGTGLSAATRRGEAVEMMTEAIRSNKELMPIIGDLYFGAMDWPMARQIAARLKKALPPALQDEEGNEDVPPHVQAQMAALQQQLQEAQQMLAQAADEIRTKKIEIDGKREIAELQAEIAIMKLKVELEGQRREHEAQRESDARERNAVLVDGVLQREADQATAGAERQAAVEDAEAERSHDATGQLLDAELQRVQALHDASQARIAAGEQQDSDREARAHEAQQATQAQAHEGASQTQAQDATAAQATQAQRATAQQAQQAQKAAVTQAVTVAKLKPKPAAKPAAKKKAAK